jgi:AraC-like DNA-binding protein
MPKQKSSTFQVDFDQGGSMARKKTRFLADGTYVFEDQLDIAGIVTARIVTCRAWLMEFYELSAGELYFISGEHRVRAVTNRFGVFYSTFSIIQPSFNNARATLLGFATLKQLPDGVPAGPILFELKSKSLPTNVAEIVEILREPDGAQSIECNPKPSLLSLKAKQLIDENYLAYPSMARIATRLGVTAEHLSRQFKRDFGMSPGNYLRQLRVADAPLMLARGEEIVNVSQDVGYNDLSRFYKQFRKTTDTSPGACKTILRPEEK